MASSKIFTISLDPRERNVVNIMAHVYFNGCESQAVKALIRQYGVSCGILSIGDVHELEQQKPGYHVPKCNLR